MEKIYGKLSKVKYIVTIVMLLGIAYFCHKVQSNLQHEAILKITLNLTHYTIYISLLVAWCISLHNRILNDKIRRVFIAVDLLMIFRLMVYVCKGLFFDKMNVRTCSCWYCIIIILVLECAIQCSLLQSNAIYADLFRLSIIRNQIMDEKTVLYETKISRKEAKHFMQERYEIQEQLSKRNELIKVEIDLEEKYLQIQEKIRLYDAITQEVKEQLLKIDNFIKQAEEEPQNIKSILAKLAVISVYIKRRGNLLLLNEECKEVSSKELEYCIRESLDNIRICDILTSLDSQCNGQILTKFIIQVFDLYESVIELFLNDMNAILIHLFCKKEEIQLCFQIGCEEHAIEKILQKLDTLHDKMTYMVEEEDIIIKISLNMED